MNRFPFQWKRRWSKPPVGAAVRGRRSTVRPAPCCRRAASFGQHRLGFVQDERDRPLHRDDLDPDPFAQLRRWLDEAHAAGIELPEAMALATATREGAPSARMVLLKDVAEDGLSFFTGYTSRKGGELAENPRAALVLYWHALGRQVRV